MKNELGMTKGDVQIRLKYDLIKLSLLKKLRDGYLVSATMNYDGILIELPTEKETIETNIKVLQQNLLEWRRILEV